MTSLAALAVLADLGFFQVTLQFAAHEFAYLKFENGRVIGSEDHKERLKSLFVFSCRWACPSPRSPSRSYYLVGFLFLSQKRPHRLGRPLARLRGRGRPHFLHQRPPLFPRGLQPRRRNPEAPPFITAVTMAFMWLGLVSISAFTPSPSPCWPAHLRRIAVWRRIRTVFRLPDGARKARPFWRRQIFACSGATP